MKRRKVKRLFWRKSRPIVVADLVVDICPECGQESLPIASARVVEDALAGRLKPTGKFTADVYSAPPA